MGPSMQDYEFRIFGDTGAVSIIVHAAHFSDEAAIKSARAFAGAMRFEVWRDLERLLPANAIPQAVLRKPAAPVDMRSENKRLYEFKLSGPGHESLLFAASLMTDDLAAEHARKLLKRHDEMTHAEIWRGMKLIRQV